MKRTLLLMVAGAIAVIAGAIAVIAGVIAIIAGAIAVIRRLSAKRRERLVRLPGAMMGWIMEHMPDE